MKYSATFQLLAAASLFGSSGAQNDTQQPGDSCQGMQRNNDWFPNAIYNASDSVSVPGFRVNDTYPESTWTWTRYVNWHSTFNDRRAIAQTITLQTDPIQNLTDASALPYTGCVVVFSDLGSNSNYKNEGSSENGSCNTILTSECRTHLLNTVTTNAASLSGQISGSRSSFSCLELFGAGGSPNSDGPCEGQWSETLSSQFLPNNFTDRTNVAEPGCPVTNVGNSTLEDGVFFSWLQPGTQVNNFTLYDRAVLNALPVLTVAWLKATGGETGNQVVVQGEGGAWLDARLMCITANQTQPGSRNLIEVESDESGAVKMAGSWTLMSAVALSVAIGLVI
ncbi:hypothetical protein ONS95_004727 [Cadophora gregata]|uniref:uncharacterized protein n=1 Tax=Cadophora gregata TaxID=51156 RepID=UPI0026DABD0E|nr:uncharacterized protein ONS95_004727 [Cadophora gregata]KAK0104437.1 hypothetical protein ONS95_004727 [Cadophora gregata]